MKQYKILWDIEKAISLYKEGYNYKEIADILNIKRMTVNCYFLRHFGKTNRESKRIELSNIQKEVLFGGLLGDINLHLPKSNKSKNAFGKVEHSTKQLELVEYKKKIFENISNNIKSIERFDIRTNKIYYSSYFNLYSNPVLTEWFTLFYKDNKKIIPDELNLLTPLALAIWYMDDGYKVGKSYGFSTNCFDKNDIEKISLYLLNKYNLKTTIHSNNRLYIIKESSGLFNYLISPYILESMKYKL